MKVVVAIDSFKGSMTSIQAGMACKEGILAAIPKADVVVRPLADGGEGTVTALVEGMNGTYEHVDVTGPMGQKVHATYGVLEDDTAVMEMAEASGITLVEGKRSVESNLIGWRDDIGCRAQGLSEFHNRNRRKRNH